MQNDLLVRGLDGLANVQQVAPGQWFHGHFGAAILAAHFIGEQLDLPEVVIRAVRSRAREIVESQPDLFAPLTSSEAAVGCDSIVDTLAENIGLLTADGHDVIYASLALKALQQRPQLATATRVAGLVQLVKNAQHDDPQRYYGCADHYVLRIEDGAGPSFSSPHQAMRYVLQDHDEVYPDQSLDGRHYFLAGSKLHNVTHAQALVDLHALGYADLAQSGLAGLEKQVFLCDPRRLPGDLSAFETHELHDPWSEAFWRRGRRDTHQVKLAYAVMSTITLLAETDRQPVLANMSKYWELLP